MSRTSKAKRDRRKKRGNKGASRARPCTGVDTLPAPGMAEGGVEQTINHALYEALPYRFNNSRDFDAIEDYIDKYASDLPEADPFKGALLDRELSHHSLVLMAHELGRYDFLEGIDALFLACNEISAYALIKKAQG